MTDTITTWYGKDIEKMSREELLEAFRELARQHHKALQDHADSAWIRARMKDRANASS